MTALTNTNLPSYERVVAMPDNLLSYLYGIRNRTSRSTFYRSISLICEGTFRSRSSSPWLIYSIVPVVFGTRFERVCDLSILVFYLLHWYCLLLCNLSIEFVVLGDIWVSALSILVFTTCIWCIVWAVYVDWIDWKSMSLLLLEATARRQFGYCWFDELFVKIVKNLKWVVKCLCSFPSLEWRKKLSVVEHFILGVVSSSEKKARSVTGIYEFGLPTK